MTDQTGGMGAEVGVKKINEDGEVSERRGDARVSAPWWAYLVWLFAIFGVWRLGEILLSLI